MAPNFLNSVWCEEAFYGLVVQDVESLILIDAFFLTDGGRRREGKKKKSPWRRVSPECHWLQLLGAIKGLFEGQSLNFLLHLM
jgi:hypothetical protein